MVYSWLRGCARSRCPALIGGYSGYKLEGDGFLRSAFSVVTASSSHCSGISATSGKPSVLSKRVLGLREKYGEAPRRVCLWTNHQTLCNERRAHGRDEASLLPFPAARYPPERAANGCGVGASSRTGSLSPDPSFSSLSHFVRHLGGRSSPSRLSCCVTSSLELICH